MWRGGLAHFFFMKPWRKFIDAMMGCRYEAGLREAGGLPRVDDAFAAIVVRYYLTQSVFKVIFQKSTSPKIRQLIRYYY